MNPSVEMSKILDGKTVAKSIKDELKEKIEKLLQQGKRAPGLAVVLVGDDPASAIYVKNKVQSCKQVGIESYLHKFPADLSQAQLLDCIKQLNENESVDGILVQLPLPKHLNEEEVLNHLSPSKDVDGLTSTNLGLLFSGKKGLRPCTPAGIIRLLKFYEIDLVGKRAVVVGRSNLVGKPTAILLLNEHATVTTCHSRTRNIDDICRQADVLVVAIGKQGFVQGDWIKEGATVIDVGIHHRESEDGKKDICGDVDFAKAVSRAHAITPVPGGVGPMTVAMLLANTLDAYERRST